VLSALLPVGLVVLALVALVIVKTTGGTSPSAGATARSSKLATANSSGGSTSSTGASPSTGTSPLPAGVLADVTSVSPATFAKVGDPSTLPLPTATKANSTLLSSDGKPEVLYIGAEFCPFCAAQRWALVVALSRFGTFTGLSATHSSTTDIYPDTKTFSFYGSTYTSPYLDFTSVEEETPTETPLQTPTSAENALLTTYDTAPYTTQSGSIPFLDIGNKYIAIGASYNPQLLQGLSMQAIAAQLNNPSSVVATAIDGTANQITAAISAITGDQPSSVANSAAIAAIVKKLGA
jgi:Domain of unknown function (DUF929)